MKNDSCPEINALNLQECRAALAMGLNNIDSIKPEYRADVQARIDAFQERIRRLEWTEESIRRVTLAGVDALAEAHAELDELRLQTEARQRLSTDAVSEIVDRIES